jgi:hypothetical protein
MKRGTPKEEKHAGSKRNKTTPKAPGKPKKATNGQRSKAAADDEDAGKMRVVTGMTSFMEYNYSLMRTTKVCAGQKWKEDKSGEVMVLRNGEGKMIATWTGRDQKVGMDDSVMRVHESLSKKV